MTSLCTAHGRFATVFQTYAQRHIVVINVCVCVLWSRHAKKTTMKAEENEEKKRRGSDSDTTTTKSEGERDKLYLS
jgi:hypothetical protein